MTMVAHGNELLACLFGCGHWPFGSDAQRVRARTVTGVPPAPRAHTLQATVHAAPLVPAAFAVHQLRYLLAYGSGAGSELGRSGHAYLHSVVPWMAAVAALGCGLMLHRAGRACARYASPAACSASFLALWLGCALALVAIFTCQELLEGVWATGHPVGLAGVFGYGGWWALPAAGCLGLVLAAAFHGARWMAERIALHRAGGPRRVRSAPARSPAIAAAIPSAAPIAAGWSERGPPGRRA
jgi:hypothetical protein